MTNCKTFVYVQTGEIYFKSLHIWIDTMFVLIGERKKIKCRSLQSTKTVTCFIINFN